MTWEVAGLSCLIHTMYSSTVSNCSLSFLPQLPFWYLCSETLHSCSSFGTPWNYKTLWMRQYKLVRITIRSGFVPYPPSSSHFLYRCIGFTIILNPRHTTVFAHLRIPPSFSTIKMRRIHSRVWRGFSVPPSSVLVIPVKSFVDCHIYWLSQDTGIGHLQDLRILVY